MRVRLQRVRSEPYRVLVVDPPWEPNDKLGSRGAAAKYTVQSQQWLSDFQLPLIANDCVLFLWRLAIMHEEACAVARAWGFNPTKGEIVWRKMTKNGKEHFGMGRTVRNCHEVCIIAKRGRPQVLCKNQRSLFSAPVPCDARGKIIHSAKPHAFFEIVCQLFEGPRVSLFERTQREGFTCIGDEFDETSHSSLAGRS